MRLHLAGWMVVGAALLSLAPAKLHGKEPQFPPEGVDLRDAMALAARSIPLRLDAAMEYRPWFLLRGINNIPRAPEHQSWDLGDMTGRYLEALILARRMGISEPNLSLAEKRLTRYLFKLLGDDGFVHEPQSGAIDHTFSQGSALFGLLALFEDSGDPAVRRAIERLISGQIKYSNREGRALVEPLVKLPESSGSHLAGYMIYPAIRFYELTGDADALTLAEGFSYWALSDPVLGANGEITKALSWEGHIHSWLETLAGCVRTARVSPAFEKDRQKVFARCRAVYDWVRRSNGTSFGWIATYPTGGSCETCAISSAIRLALELAASGYPEYLDDVERFVRNQVLEAQFTSLEPFSRDRNNPPSPLLLGTFDSQSMPNGHLGTRGGEDVGTVEGCCLNGGMRALSLAWEAIETSDENTINVNLALTRSGPACDVIGYQPFAGRVDVIPRYPAKLRVRVPPWVDFQRLIVTVKGKKTRWRFERGYVVLDNAAPGVRVSVTYPLREMTEKVTAGGQGFQVTWKGDTVMAVAPPGSTAPTYVGRSEPAQTHFEPVPDTWFLPDAARLASCSMLARMDLQREGQPFFRIFPFAKPPRAEHEKWDDGDMTGRYVEALILARRLSGIPFDPREALLRNYLMKLYDLADGLCYTRGTEWTPRRACLFSQSSAMLGLLAWHAETGSPEARKLLDWQFDGLKQIAVIRGDYAFFPKYEFDGTKYVDEPKDKNAPPWYGGRLILPLTRYWQLSERPEAREFVSKLVRYVTEISTFIGADGAVEQGEGWWGHLHSTMDMAAGVAEFGRLTNQPELVEWAKRVYEWIGRTQTTRYGFVADVSGGRICESCAIASRFRLGLALHRAGAVDPFGEIDRHLRNQLLENQFFDVSFLAPMRPQTPRTSKVVYAGLDTMIRGTFQCWGTPNELIGNDDIEGCGAGGGVIGLALAAASQSDWADEVPGGDLRIHLLFNSSIRAQPDKPFSTAAPITGELWSWLPFEGRVRFRAHQDIARVQLRLPDGADLGSARIRTDAAADANTQQTARLQKSGAGLQDQTVSLPTPALPSGGERQEKPAELHGQYVVVVNVRTGQTIEITFGLREYETVETAAGVQYRVQWKGSSVTSLKPAGKRKPLYADRLALKTQAAPMAAPRYSR